MYRFFGSFEEDVEGEELEEAELEGEEEDDSSQPLDLTIWQLWSLQKNSVVFKGSEIYKYKKKFFSPTVRWGQETSIDP